MEFESLILNVGLRYDYFSARCRLFDEHLRIRRRTARRCRPTVDPSTLLAQAEGKHQWSPRIGVSFPITDKGIIHFSYGHFFQMPPFSYLYANPNFKYSFSSGTPTFGNADLNPQQTVTYELGLQQQLMENLSFNLTGFYKDVRDLLALQQIRISGDETYYKYVNKDYSNVKGHHLLAHQAAHAPSDLVGATLDYTFQVAEGNETDANAFFVDLSSGRQSEKVPVYLDWDQSHTLNATVTVGQPSDWNVTLVGRLGTGLPYTPQITRRKPSICKPTAAASRRRRAWTCWPTRPSPLPGFRFDRHSSRCTTCSTVERAVRVRRHRPCDVHACRIRRPHRRRTSWPRRFRDFIRPASGSCGPHSRRASGERPSVRRADLLRRSAAKCASGFDWNGRHAGARETMSTRARMHAVDVRVRAIDVKNGCDDDLQDTGYRVPELLSVLLLVTGCRRGGWWRDAGREDRTGASRPSRTICSRRHAGDSGLPADGTAPADQLIQAVVPARLAKDVRRDRRRRTASRSS